MHVTTIDEDGNEDEVDDVARRLENLELALERLDARRLEGVGVGIHEQD